MPLSAAKGSLGACTTYSNLHGKLFDRDASVLSLKLTSELHRFLQESRILRAAQLHIRLPLDPYRQYTLGGFGSNLLA